MEKGHQSWKKRRKGMEGEEKEEENENAVQQCRSAAAVLGAWLVVQNRRLLV